MIFIIALFETRTCDARRQKSTWHKPLKFTHPSTASAYLNTDLKQQQHVKGPRSDRLLTEGGNVCFCVPDCMTPQPVSQVQNFLGQAKQYRFGIPGVSMFLHPFYHFELHETPNLQTRR